MNKVNKKTEIIKQNSFLDQLTPATNCLDTRGFKQGLWEYYNDFGNGLILITSKNYKDDKLHGEMRMYHHDGSLMSIDRYKNGLRQGLCEIFKMDGEIQASANFNKGKINKKDKHLKDLFRDYNLQQ